MFCISINVITLKSFLWSAEGLLRITTQKTSAAMQVSAENPMVGIDGRSSLLSSLGSALKNNVSFFGSSARPGNMLGMPLATDALLFPFVIHDHQISSNPRQSLKAQLLRSISPHYGQCSWKDLHPSGLHVLHWAACLWGMCGAARHSHPPRLMSRMILFLFTS